MVGHDGTAQHSRSARGEHQGAEQEEHARMNAAIPSGLFIRLTLHGDVVQS